ncbi:MAG: PIG-L deacetylase family protein [Gammaproteobacteria bacterium]
MKALTPWLLRRLSRAAKPYLNSYGLMRTPKIFNGSALEWQPSNERVVVLAPHMDDEVIGCGGTLVRHLRCGSQVTVVYITDGRLGGDATTRKTEARAALAELGVTQAIYLDAADGSLGDAPQVAVALRRMLEETRPAILYLPFFLEEHPDHRAVSALLAAAVRGGAFDFRCHGYEVWTPLFPNCLVPIDAVIDVKRRALAHYRSQLTEVDYLHTGLGLNAYRSGALLDVGCRFAEAFCAVSLDEYLELWGAYGGAALA